MGGEVHSRGDAVIGWLVRCIVWVVRYGVQVVRYVVWGG